MVQRSVKPNKKKRVYIEDIKSRHTTHWDFDYLSMAELEALYRTKRTESAPGERKTRWPTRRKTLAAVLAGSAALLLAAVLILIFRL